MADRTPGIDDIERARATLAGRVRRTFLEPSPSLTALTGAPVHLKLEHQQVTGSFKLRGATNAIASLSAAERRLGVVGVSTGNHGRGLAHAAAAAGVRCVVCVPAVVPEFKVEAIRALGAEVRVHGRSQDDAEAGARQLAESGLVLLPPFDHVDVIAGQGTLGLELLEDLPQVETVVAPLSGGGLIGGIALAVKHVCPDVRVIGVSMERGAAMAESQRAGKPVPVLELETLADALVGGIGLDNAHTFDLVRRLVDEIVTLTEPEIAAGVRHAYLAERQIVEGAGAAGIAALLAAKLRPRGPTAIVLSGGNIAMPLHRRLAIAP